MNRLEEYRRKRDPKRTTEPFGAPARAASEPVFVVQRHVARRLHYDLRLERDGVLASWAVPRGLPTEPGSRHLAVHVEDHPLDYATFEGVIPTGQYGAGTVDIWDRGTYELLEEKKDGGLTVRLKGARLQGVWTLVPAELDGNPKNWLLVRKRDSVSPPDRQYRKYEPMLATLTELLPVGQGWVYEVKWDGYRALCRLREGEAELWSRTGKELPARLAEITRALQRAIRSPDCVVDGEICALDEHGRPSFALMQRGAGTLVIELFDLLELDGTSLLDQPLSKRRERLSELVDTRGGVVRLSESFGDGEALLDATKREGLEGVIAKLASSPYRPGRRTQEWLKIKSHEQQEFLIAGYTRGQGRRAGSLGALVLAVRHGDEFVWAGNCGTGFTEARARPARREAPPLRRETSPLRPAPRMPRVRKDEVVWVTPKVVCEVEFAEWTRDGRLRSPPTWASGGQGAAGCSPGAAAERGSSAAVSARSGCVTSTRSSGRKRD